MVIITDHYNNYNDVFLVYDGRTEKNERKNGTFFW